MNNSLASSRDFCVACSSQPYDLVCSCGSKFDFFCINTHVQEIRLEFDFVQSNVGQKLFQVEQLIESNNCTNARTILENWRQKRLQEINDLADQVLNEIKEYEDLHSTVPTIRDEFNSLAESIDRVVHKQLDSIYSLDQQIQTTIDQLNNLPTFIQNDTILDEKLQSKLNLNVVDATLTTLESIVPTSSLDKEANNDSSTMTVKPISSSMTADSALRSSESQASDEFINLTPLENKDSSASVSIENDQHLSESSEDDFEPGITACIHRRNAIKISTSNDKFAGTLCSYGNELLYNNYNSLNGTSHLVLIPNIENSTVRQTIQWYDPDTIVGGGDNNWIQDITYSNILGGYLILNHSRLRFLPGTTHELEEFCQFPDRSMRRVTCNDKYIYLLSAAGITNQYGDEIILINYDKKELVSKTFRDILLHNRNDFAGFHMGEISDIGVNNDQQIMLAYRLNHRTQVRVCIFTISNNGNRWTIVKELILDECWRDDTLYTPRLEWCERFRCFALVEYITCHLIMLDVTGQSKGETRFNSIQDVEEPPLNISFSNNDWLFTRYKSSINIHRIDFDRL